MIPLETRICDCGNEYRAPPADKCNPEIKEKCPEYILKIIEGRNE
jgi:hypothetical protein